MYTERYYKEELCHHGIKGQQWGVRRYQYENGSLTPEGRIHYGVGNSRIQVRSGDYSGYTTKKATKPAFSGHRKTSQEIKTKLKDDLSQDMRRNAFLYILAPLAPQAFMMLSGRLISHAGAMHAINKRDKDLEQYELNRANTAKYNKQKGVYEQLNKPSKVLNSEKEVKSIATEVNKLNRGLQKHNIEANNCACCSNAYIMRRKGYETLANSSEEGYFLRDYASAFPKSKVNNFYKKYDKSEPRTKQVIMTNLNNSELFTGKDKPKKEYAVTMGLSKSERENIKTEFFNSINKSENGSYGTITVNFNSAPAGHVFNYEVINNKIYAVDCQRPNKIVQPLDKYLNSFNELGGLSYIAYNDVSKVEPDFNNVKEYLI